MDRVLLVADVKGWAWWHKALAIQRHLQNEFERLDVAVLKDMPKINKSRYHSIHFFGWQDGLKYQGIATAGISSHNFLHKQTEKAKKRLPRYRALTAVSKELYEILKARRYNSNIHLCENGVDCDLFTPKRNDGPFTVGWVGQPSKKPLDQHGYETHWLPLKKRLLNAGICVAELCRTWQNAVPHEEMVPWYRAIDVLVHTGRMTGTPNPLFEAAACGKAVVSTPIGCAPEFIVNGVNGYLIEGEEDAYETLLTMNRRRDLCNVLGEQARVEVQKSWQWRDKAREWLPVLKDYRRVL